VELRRELGEVEDLVILYVLPDNQVNEKTLRFIDGNSLRDRVRFLQDPASRAIDRLGLRKPGPEPIEAGVPHPATYVLDRQGRIGLIDVREDYHIWLDPEPVIAALERIP
jgi:peroxiredoxin